MMQALRSFAIRWAKRSRIYLNRQGYDLHAIDQRCWDDQVALLAGREVKVVFDVGASGGSVAAQYRQVFPQSRLYCFEAQEDSLPLLRSRFAGDPAVSFHMVAVGAARGTARFHLTRSRDSSSLLASGGELGPAKYRAFLAIEMVKEVEVIALDDFAGEHGIDRIDILKMDIQGGECAALAGAKRLLAEGRIRLLYLEACLVPLYANHPLLGDLAKCLAPHDYTLHYLYNGVIDGASGRTYWCDAIFVSPELYSASRELLGKTA
jgi:FkbM family methyltransferase